MLFIILSIVEAKICQSESECREMVIQGEDTHLRDTLIAGDTPGWEVLHNMTLLYSDDPSDSEKENIFEGLWAFGRLQPCPVCREDFIERLEKTPPRLKNREELAKWGCDIHN